MRRTFWVFRANSPPPRLAEAARTPSKLRASLWNHFENDYHISWIPRREQSPTHHGQRSPPSRNPRRQPPAASTKTGAALVAALLVPGLALTAFTPAGAWSEPHGDHSHHYTSAPALTEAAFPTAQPGRARRSRPRRGNHRHRGHGCVGGAPGVAAAAPGPVCAGHHRLRHGAGHQGAHRDPRVAPQEGVCAFAVKGPKAAPRTGYGLRYPEA